MLKTDIFLPGKRPFLFMFICLWAVSLACRFEQALPPFAAQESNAETEGETAVSPALPALKQPQQDPPAAPPQGSSRANPHPPGTSVTLNDWEVEVLDIQRGDPAWQEIHLANSNNKQAPPGWEYLLLKIRLKNNSASEENQYFSIHVTGNGRVLHYSFNHSVVPPAPELAYRLVGGEESSGWHSLLIKQGEGNLMLYLEDGENYETPPVYLALEEGAAITIDRETLLNIPPSELGLSPQQPVPFGQTATGEDWQVIVLDVVRGDAAYQTLLKVNQFNDPPAEDMEYILVKLRVRYIGLQETEQYISDVDFSIYAANGAEYDSPSTVDPDPNLSYQLYAGGEADGWIVLQAPVETKNITLRFSPDNSGANERYLSLGQGR